jgi:TIGR03009 family protein
MRRSSRLAAALVAGACTVAVAFGQAPPPRQRPAAKRQAPDPAAEQANRRKLSGILGEWEKQSKGLHSLDVRFNRRDVSPAWDGADGPTEFRGRALLQSPDHAFLRFERVEREKAKERLVIHEDIICTGKHVLQYAYPTRQVFVYPLSQEARNRALEEGPLPFLFNMQAASLEARFKLRLRDQVGEAYLIEIFPRLPHDQESFASARLWLNMKTYLPDKLVLYSTTAKDRKEYEFCAIHTNPEIKPSLFQGISPEGWTIVRNPGPSPAPPRAATRSRRPAAK